jgi:hypothetical protein
MRLFLIDSACQQETRATTAEECRESIENRVEMKIKILDKTDNKTFVFPMTNFFYRISLKITREDSNKIIDEWNTSCLDHNNNIINKLNNNSNKNDNNNKGNNTINDNNNNTTTINDDDNSNNKNNNNDDDNNNNTINDNKNSKNKNNKNKNKNNNNNTTVNDNNNNNKDNKYHNIEAKDHEEMQRAIRCLKKLTEEVENEIDCHELLSEWNPILDGCKFWVEGVAVCVIGVFGLCGNTLAIVALGNNKVANK